MGNFALIIFKLIDEAYSYYGGFPGGASAEELACQCRRLKRRSLGLEDPLEEDMAIHSSILAWRIHWTEEHSWLRSIELPRVGHD